MGELGRHRGVWRTLGLSVAWLLLAAAAGLALLYAVPELQLVHRLATLAAVFIPFGVLLWGAAVLLFLAAGRGWGKLLALVAVAGLVLAVLWARPYWPAGIGEDGPTGPDAGGGGGVIGTVMTFNARCDSAWADELEESIVARPDVPVLVAGDFNAVREHGPLRRLLGRFGLESAAEQAGAGWVPTYPADTWYPPVLAIDHVLVGPGLEAVGVETVRIGGYAHLALVVEVRAR